jgi:hypothetical protein
LIPNELLVRVARTHYADAGLRSCSEHEFGRQTNWENLEALEFMQRLAALVPHPRLHLIRFPVATGGDHSLRRGEGRLNRVRLLRINYLPKPLDLPFSCISPANRSFMRLNIVAIVAASRPNTPPRPSTDTPSGALLEIIGLSSREFFSPPH